VKTESIRLLLAFAAVEGFGISFLHGRVVQDIYIYAPEGAGFREGAVLKLNITVRDSTSSTSFL
jgi:hypothetical protein